jgi:cyclase
MEKLIGEGKSEDDVLAAKPFADFDAKFAATDQASQTFIRAAYRSLKSGASAPRPSITRLPSTRPFGSDRVPC